MGYKKKLIEIALPLEVINAASAREKSIRHGHPSTLHLWWARRPLAAARAVIWSSLVDDPSSHPELFPTEEAQNFERQRLFTILEKLVKWENTNNPEILAEAKAEIMKSTGGNPPALLDPFAGGGAIPLEAQRLGLKAHASDLNPVAVMINKATIEIPPKYAGHRPVNPEACVGMMKQGWVGAAGLAEDVRYYGKLMKQEAFKSIGHFYPKVKVPKEQGGGEATVIAWIWARTVKCPNPACGCEMPLASSLGLSKKRGKEAYVVPIIEGKKIRFETRIGKDIPEPPKTARGANFKCIRCGEPTVGEYIRQEAIDSRMGSMLMAIVAEGPHGRIYITPDEQQTTAAKMQRPINYPTGNMPKNPRWFSPPLYGMPEFHDIFSNRQLTALTTFSGLVEKMREEVAKDGGSIEYANAISVYLAFIIDQMANHSSTLCLWNEPNEQMAMTFSRQALPMVWNYAECNMFSNSTGSFDNLIERQVKGLSTLGLGKPGTVTQADAQSGATVTDVMVSTDPPYYDNIGYADLSDFFYLWLRQSLKGIYPELFHTMLVPKKEELVATPYRFSGGMEEAKTFFESGMRETFARMQDYVCDSIPLTVYYAFKQSESDISGDVVQTASSGWETMLSAMIQAGFTLVGTWPIRTERPTGLKAYENALASSIVLVCRKRSANAPICTRRDFINTLKRELKPALAKLQASNIAPVDLAQSAIGPGMGVYSRFSKVLEADGTPMSIRSALQIINQELDLYFTEQDGEIDRDSRFCVDLYTQYAFNDMKFGEADVLARAKNTSVDKLANLSVLYAQKGVVRLLTREEIPEKVETNERNIWLLTQQITIALEKDGVLGTAKIVADIYTSEPEHAKNLAYRLFTIAERKGWASEAYAYNSLVIAWPDIQSKVAELKAQYKSTEQISIFEVDTSH